MNEETTRILVRRLFTFAARTTVVGDGYEGLSLRRLYVHYAATQCRGIASSCGSKARRTEQYSTCYVLPLPKEVNMYSSVSRIIVKVEDEFS